MNFFRAICKFNKILSVHQKKRIIELIILMLFGGLLETFSISLVLPFMTSIMDSNSLMDRWYINMLCNLLKIDSPSGLVIFLSLLLAFLFVLKNIYLLFEYNIQYKFVYENMFAMERRLFETMIHRPYEKFLDINSGEVIRIVTNDTSASFSLLMTILSLCTEMIVAVMLIIAIFIIAPVITVGVTLLIFTLVLVINLIIKPILSSAGEKQQIAVTGMNKWLLQSMQGIKEVKVMRKEDFFIRNFDYEGRNYIKSLRLKQTFMFAPRFMIEAICMGAMFVVVALFIHSGVNFESIIPMLTAVALTAVRLLPSVNRISGALSEISYEEPMLDKMIENLNILSERTDLSNHKDIKDDNHPRILNQCIELKNIEFSYPNSKIKILDNANLTIKCGESIGIVGSSGEGKSTTIDVILGLLMPQRGSILIDGADIFMDLEKWLSIVGYVPQSIFMMDDDIRSNIAFGVSSSETDDERVLKALEDASLLEFVRSLPDGINTQIGERGVRLSGGQRQRIGIARALYRNPEVLIFDEATSALDNDTETTIVESINRLRGKKTMIIVAHRLSTIEKCDHIYRVINGRIVLEED